MRKNRFLPSLEILERRDTPAGYYWNPLNGSIDFNRGDNWLDGANQRYAFANGPNENSSVVFNDPNNTTVLLTDSVTVKTWIEQITINMNYDLNTKTLTIKDGGGTLKTGTWNMNAGEVVLDGTTTITTTTWGGVTGGGKWTVNGNAKIDFDSDNGFNFKTDLLVNGTVEFRRGVTVNIDTYDIDVNNGGMLRLMPSSGTLRIDAADLNANTLTNQGTIHKMFGSAIVELPVLQNATTSQTYVEGGGTLAFDARGRSEFAFKQTAAGSFEIEVGCNLAFSDGGYFQTSGKFQPLHKWNATEGKMMGGSVGVLGNMDFMGGNFKFGNETVGTDISFVIMGNLHLEGVTVYMSTYANNTRPPNTTQVPTVDNFYVNGTIYMDMGSTLKLRDTDGLLPANLIHAIFLTFNENHIGGNFANKYSGWGTDAFVYDTNVAHNWWAVYRGVIGGGGDTGGGGGTGGGGDTGGEEGVGGND